MEIKKKNKNLKEIENNKNKVISFGKGKKTVNSKKEETPKEAVINNWIYMTPQVINARMIADILNSKTNLEVDIWEELDVLEVELSNESIVDFEPMDTNFKDSSDAAFVKNREIKTIFAVTIDDGALKETKAIMKLIIQDLGGFLCADSVDFNPIYDENNIDSNDDLLS